MSYDDRLASYLRRTRQLVTAELHQVLHEDERAGRGGEPLARAIREILDEWAALSASDGASADGNAANTAA
jgi:hypothetical protein